MAIAFPDFSPTAFEIGPLSVKWYGIAYVVGILLGWRYILYLEKKASQAPYNPVLPPKVFDLYVPWLVLGILLGGRLGYVLFYKPLDYLTHPEEILFTWKGGMSFHGGLIGVIISTYLFTRKHKIPLLFFTDMLSQTIPIGLFFGRIANFINSELYGRITDVPWAVVFPTGGPFPRHPSQLYEAFLEGPILFLLLFFFSRCSKIASHKGSITGLFLIGYAAARFSVEFVRQPDAYLGFLWGGFTMGQLLTLPMFALGLFLLLRGRHGHHSSSSAYS